MCNRTFCLHDGETFFIPQMHIFPIELAKPSHIDNVIIMRFVDSPQVFRLEFEMPCIVYSYATLDDLLHIRTTPPPPPFIISERSLKKVLLYLSDLARSLKSHTVIQSNEIVCKTNILHSIYIRKYALTFCKCF